MVRYAKKVDNNHAEIRDGLRDYGYEVGDLSAVGGGVPDLMVRIVNGRSLFLEVKDSRIKKAEQALTDEQEKWWYYNHETTRIVQTLSEALRECEWVRQRWASQ
jgi:hypothetical protein